MVEISKKYEKHPEYPIHLFPRPVRLPSALLRQFCGPFLHLIHVTLRLLVPVRASLGRPIKPPIDGVQLEEVVRYALTRIQTTSFTQI